MAADLYPSDEYASDGVAYPPLSSPAEVLRDQFMTPDAKRAVLAGWASDLRAVENRPALRQLDDGTLLDIDDILEALKALDLSAEPTKGFESVLAFPRRPSQFRSGVGTDDDDDPPPSPMAQRQPMGRRAQRVLALHRGGAYAAA